MTLSNKESASYKFLKSEVDTLATKVAVEKTEALKTEDIFKKMDTYGKLATAFAGWGGMTDEESADYVKETFIWADSIKARSTTIAAIHEWVEQQMDEIGGEQRYVMCGYVLYDTQTEKPKYFVECNDELSRRKIYYGRPSGVNLNSGKKVYYYKNEDDKNIILSMLSNY
jgi:hypothetical protein